ncbi:hypothetical protein NE865_01439 [Phthorimaea operculella]|nr:hypothetical protein NE865_01439 [Phthorimaea operculella]
MSRLTMLDPDVELVTTPEIDRWISEVERALEEICSISNDSTKKLDADQKLRINYRSKDILAGIAHLATKYQSIKYKYMIANRELNSKEEEIEIAAQIEDLKQCVKSTPNPAPQAASFADAVKIRKNSVVHPTASSSIAIYPANKDSSSDDTKKLVQTLIKPDELKLHIRGVRNTKNGGVIISTNGKEDLEKLRKSEKLIESGLTLEVATKRRPKIILLGVPSSTSEAELKDCIYEQNIAGKLPNLTKDRTLSSIRLSHKSGRKDAPSCNFIIEVTAELRKFLIQQGRLFINWTSCPVRDFTLVTRCFKCQQYGHSAKFCKDASPTCGHCGSTGHSFKDCNNKAQPEKCATCLRFQKPSAHKTGDEQCPARKSAELRLLNSIDYVGA